MRAHTLRKTLPATMDVDLGGQQNYTESSAIPRSVPYAVLI
jgi:hypothetical protein